MTFIRLMLLTAALFSGAQAYAADAHKNSWEAARGGSARKWTAHDVQLYCEDRFRGQQQASDRCIQRNQRRTGRTMTPGEMQEMQSLGDEGPKPDNSKHEKAKP